MVSPLWSKNKNSSPSASPSIQLSPDTDSVDASASKFKFDRRIHTETRIRSYPTVVANFDCEPNCYLEPKLGDESNSFESDISTINDCVPWQTKKEMTKQCLLQIFESLTLKDTEVERRKNHLRLSSIVRLMITYWYLWQSVRNTTIVTICLVIQCQVVTF